MPRLPPLLARVPLLVIALGALWVLRDVAYPAASLATTIHGQPVRISFAAPHDAYLGKQLSGLPAFLPCSVRVNVDPRWMGAYGADGALVWILAHEVGHCVERDLPGGKPAHRPRRPA